MMKNQTEKMYSAGIHLTVPNWREGNRPRPPGSGDQGIAQEKSVT